MGHVTSASALELNSIDQSASTSAGNLSSEKSRSMSVADCAWMAEWLKDLKAIQRLVGIAEGKSVPVVASGGKGPDSGTDDGLQDDINIDLRGVEILCRKCQRIVYPATYGCMARVWGTECRGKRRSVLDELKAEIVG